jgi:4-alpha-glucanotransferase
LLYNACGEIVMRKSGILLAVSSLPSPYGIGDFGPQAYRWLRLLKKAGVKAWQVLPLNPLGYGNSPYQPYSSNAMDELYLSLDLLKKDQLIKTLKPFQKQSTSVQYDAVRKFKSTYLQTAFQAFKPNRAYQQFIQQNSWVRQYAIFITFKKLNQLRLWTEWPKQFKEYGQKPTKDLSAFEPSIAYEMFLQFKLFEQWSALQQFALKLGIELIGDIPIYVGIDSDDVWFNQDQFLLNADGNPTHIAGVPPDYFSKTGQRWGNPLYRWDKMEKDGFQFWLNRLRYNATLFDTIRIDHFRGFDTYWKIPASCPTAVEGAWIEAPGHALFHALRHAYPDLNIIAEDLGDLRPEVLALRDHFQLPGMKIIQFVIELNPSRQDVNQQPYLTTSHAVAYTGTHDNQTTRGWYESLSSQAQKILEQFLIMKGLKKDSIAQRMVTYTLLSLADLAVIPLQDILELDDRARMNTPGTVGSPNWEWKLVDFQSFIEKIPSLKKLIKQTKRA